MKKITDIKFSKEDLIVLDKLSRINDKVFISSDKLRIIDGQLKPDGSSNNRFNGGNRTAEYTFSSPFSFIDDLGICKLPSLISSIKSLKEDYVIEVYDKYLNIKDSDVCYKFWLTPEENNMIPKVSDTIMDRAKNSTKPKIQFNMPASQLQILFDVQKNIGTFTTFFFMDSDGNLQIKVSESFEENGSNTATIKITKEQIESDNLEEIKNGKHVRFDYIRNDYIMNDDYKFFLNDKAIFAIGESCRTNYIIKSTFVNLE
jgi:hypothetical protein